MNQLFRVCLFGICLLVFAMAEVSLAQSTDTKPSEAWPGKQSKWNGFQRYDFEVDGRSAYVVMPKHAAPGKPWVWRARFPNFHAEADLILLDRGFHIARINTDGMLGSPNAMKHWDAFYQFIIDRGLAKKCVLEGVSRGGLFVYGFASRWPERVSCIHCDTPVCDIRSWPGGKGTGRGHVETWKRCLAEYGLTESTAKDFADNPIDKLKPVADAKIPILHIVSLNDEIVPPNENTFVLAKAYRELGGTIDVMTVAKGTEKSGGHHFVHPEPIRVADFVELHGSTFPKDYDYIKLRGSLYNYETKFRETKKGRIVFLGGSITNMEGWRGMTMNFFRERFPGTEFDFINAGIPSMGSTPGAFRLTRDVFEKGEVDLLFAEAAVNDLHNMRTPTEMVRGMEGIVRHARRVNPNIDIVMMHFVDKKHMADYRNEKTPPVISTHESVAEHYQIPSIDLAREVTDRIDAKQFDWKNDFKNVHPSPFGHRLYASSLRRLFTHASSSPPNVPKDKLNPHPLPAPLDQFNYSKTKLLAPTSVSDLSGFKLVENCDPREGEIGGNVRQGFYDVPMLVGTKAGDSFSFEFKGRAIGLLVVAGPDAGTIEYSIDGREYKTVNLFTQWSFGLHIPWTHILNAELSDEEHELRVRVPPQSDARSKGNACRIVEILVNE